MMEITCFGCRGSHVVSGPKFSAFGGHTTSYRILSPECETAFFVDAGTGICNAVLPDSIHKAVLFFTHTHLDHIIGFPFLPALQKKGFELTICGPVAAYGAGIKDIMTTLFAPAFFPVCWNEFPAHIRFFDFQDETQTIFDGTEIQAFRLPHSCTTLGCRLKIGNHTAAFCFDAELEALSADETEKIGRLIEGSDLLIADGTYTAEEYENGRRGFGHSAAETAAVFAERFFIKQLGISHHSPTADDNTLTAREQLLKKRFSKLDLSFLREGMTISLS